MFIFQKILFDLFMVYRMNDNDNEALYRLKLQAFGVSMEVILGLRARSWVEMVVLKPNNTTVCHSI